MRQVLDLMKEDIESKLGNQINRPIFNKIKNGLFAEPEYYFSKCDALSAASTHESVDLVESKFSANSAKI